MAMTVTYDEGSDYTGREGMIHRVICTWTSDGAGAASGTTKKIVGELIKGVTNPGATAPDPNYDITLTDEDGVNLLGSSADDLVDRHTSNSEAVYFNLTNGTTPIASYPVVCGTIAVAVAAAGATKNGVLTLFYRRK